MRDFGLPNITFTDDKGKSYSIKDMKDYTENSYQTWFDYELQNEEQIDEIASRKSVYGEGSESEFYRIMEHNMIALFDNMFDMSRIKTLKIPLP